MEADTKSHYFPISTFGCDPDEFNAKKEKVESAYAGLVKGGNVRKGDKFLKDVAKEADSEETGTKLVEAVRVEVGLSAEDKIVRLTGMNPGEFIAEQLLNVIAEPEVTVSFNEKSGLTYQMKSQPSVKVKALEGLTRLTSANHASPEIPKGVAALPLSDLLNMQNKLELLTRERENSAKQQRPQNHEDKSANVIENTA